MVSRLLSSALMVLSAVRPGLADPDAPQKRKTVPESTGSVELNRFPRQSESIRAFDAKVAAFRTACAKLKVSKRESLEACAMALEDVTDAFSATERSHAILSFTERMQSSQRQEREARIRTMENKLLMMWPKKARQDMNRAMAAQIDGKPLPRSVNAKALDRMVAALSAASAAFTQARHIAHPP
jgi:hypothetical protein